MFVENVEDTKYKLFFRNLRRLFFYHTHSSLGPRAKFFSTHVLVQKLGSGFGLGFGLWFGLGVRVKGFGLGLGTFGPG